MVDEARPEPHEFDDADLSRAQTLKIIDRMRGGDQRASEDLYRRTGGRVLGMIMYLMGPDMRSKFDPEDVAQEVWEEIFKSIEKAPPTTAFGPWARTIARRKISRLKQVGDKAPIPQSSLQKGSGGEGGLEPEGVITHPSLRSFRKESVQRLVQALESLHPDQSRAWTLHWFEEQTYAEIAPQLGKSVEAVTQIVKRVTKALRERVSGMDTSLPRDWSGS